MKILRLIFFFILVFSFWYSMNIEKIFYIEKESTSESRIEPMSEISVESFKPIPDRDITMREAIALSIEQAKIYDKNPELISIGSLDGEKGTGKNGKKPNWHSMISLPNAKYRMNINIENGKLKKYSILEPSDVKPIKNQDISVDSDKFIKLAIRKHGLKPITSKKSSFNNYHFRIQRNDEQRPLFIIEGQTKSGKYIEIYFNPFNGKYLGKGIKEEIGMVNRPSSKK